VLLFPFEMTNILVKAYGVASYLYAFYMINYASAFLLNASHYWPALFGSIFPRSIDFNAHENARQMSPYVWNSLWIGLFGVQHLIMARVAFKQALAKVIPADAERSTFVLASSLCLHALFENWLPITGTMIWHVEQSDALFWPLVGAFLFGVALLFLATFSLDHFELFGVSQSLWGVDKTPPTLKVQYLYAVVRHPIMSAFFIMFSVTPSMSIGHLFFTFMCTVFIVFTVYTFEEPGLVRLFGDDYEHYRKQVPSFCPMPFVRSAAPSNSKRD
jgi:methanethiol S-methyltransferase